MTSMMRAISSNLGVTLTNPHPLPVLHQAPERAIPPPPTYATTGSRPIKRRRENGLGSHRRTPGVHSMLQIVRCRVRGMPQSASPRTPYSTPADFNSGHSDAPLGYSHRALNQSNRTANQHSPRDSLMLNTEHSSFFFRQIFP